MQESSSCDSRRSRLAAPRTADDAQPLLTRRAGGARPLILGGHVAHDLSAQNGDVTRCFDAEPHTFAVARQYDDAYSVADQDGIAGFSSEAIRPFTFK